jgi:formylglycine-generating enzyme required for sulfatase activity
MSDLLAEAAKLPELDKEDLKAIRSFLPGKLLGRTAALLSLLLLVLGFVGAVRVGVHQIPELEQILPTWAFWALLAFCFLAVLAQIILEWRAKRNRAVLQELAIKPGAVQTGYFRIGAYADTAEDRKKFGRPDQAERKVLDWLTRTTQMPLFLTGDSGSGKSSLLNAFVLPEFRAQGWTVIEARAWQDPLDALRKALARPQSTKRSKIVVDWTPRGLIEDTARKAKRLLMVLDQFEEFVILAKPESHQAFAAFVTDLRSRPIENFVLLLVLRSDYQSLLEDAGLPALRSGENLFQLARFQFPAAEAFMKGSKLDLQPRALDRLLTSAAELDDTPGLVRPITINVLGYVLASGRTVAASLDAGTLVRRYIEQTLRQPAIRDHAPPLLERMITEQGTKQPKSEESLAADARLRPAEVRAVLNCLNDAGLARPLDPARGVWELSHDFVAHAVGRFLGRRRSQMLRQTGAYAAPVLLAFGLAVGLWMSRSALNELMYWYFTVRPHVLTAAQERALKPRDPPFKECPDCPEMIVIPAGEFMMGSEGRNEGPRHKVTIAKPFAVARFDLTFAEWDACAAHGDCDPDIGDNGWGRNQQPVIQVSWDDAQTYVAWLSRVTRKPYRLLTEAEWEYAARAGSTTTYYWGDEFSTGNANCTNCGSPWDDQQTAPIQSFAANAFGLYDMGGNVFQWVQDCWHFSYYEAPEDGSAWATGEYCNRHVIRGGSWRSTRRSIRTAARSKYTAETRTSDTGFRVGRTITP